MISGIKTKIEEDKFKILPDRVKQRSIRQETCPQGAHY